MFNINVPKVEEIINSLAEKMDNIKNEFNKRDDGLKLKTFLSVFTIKISDMVNVTLEGLANKCIEMQYGLSTFTKQALHNRLEAGSKELKKLLEETINMTIENKVTTPQITPVLGQFNRVLISDSVTVSLPDALEREHKGLGGKNAKSALKIQATYDIKGRDFENVEIIDNATSSDGSYAEEIIKRAEKNDLIINDLGYYGISGFKAIEEKGAFFISRTKSNSNFYKVENKSKKIEIKEELKGKEKIDKEVVVKGANGEWMEVRLVGIRLPEEVYNERIRKAKIEAKKKQKATIEKAKMNGKTITNEMTKGEVLTAEEIERLQWILIITNVGEEILGVKLVCEIYRIRWKIELIFKTWKSYFKIDEMNNIKKPHYLNCLIYG
ncbi:MAG: IS4 family transposase, partial [Oscillospiraceae bacterium]|nr:IS4 family transposase [Oscillospiraceae bacterium]